jgi:DNA polymerase
MNKMTHFTQKINQLKWLQAIGIDYYFSQSINKQKILDVLDSRLRGNDIKGNRDNIKEVQMPLRKTPTKSLVDSNSSNHSSIPDEFQELARRSQTVVPTRSPIVPQHQHLKGEGYIQLARDLANLANSLEELKKLLMNFNGCGLKKLANKTVFADGNPQSSIMFIGEAPGSNEDAQGIPFCGESGKLLDNVLASINISREHNAYITNTVFWRPPANRQPTQEEIDICRPFVEKHIALINPKLIVLVGNVAATSLLGKNAGISKIRQEYYLYTNQYLSKPIQTTSIFHPAYLLRQPMQKKNTWYDLLKIHEYINTNIGI